MHIAKILSANEEVRTGRAKSNFVFANFTLDGPASRMEEKKYLMGLGADSPLHENVGKITVAITIQKWIKQTGRLANGRLFTTKC